MPISLFWPHGGPRPMAVGGHLHGSRDRSRSSATRSAHFVEREGGAEGVGEEVALVGRGFGGVGVDESLYGWFVVRAGEVAVEQEAAGGGDADGFGDHGARLGDVVDDAVADDDVETRRRRTAVAWRRRARRRCGR